MFEWHGLVIPIEKVNDFPDTRPIEFGKLLEKRNLMFIQQRGRDLGVELNTILRKRDINSKVFVRGTGGDATVNIYQMILKGRADYTIDYRFMVDFYNRNTPNSKEHFMYIPLQETHKNFGYGAVVCTNSPIGKAVIDQVNVNIVKWRKKYFKEINHKWFAPQEQQEKFWEHWDNDFSSLTH